MKFKFVILLLSFGVLFSKIEYDLSNGVEKTITNVNRNTEYSFYIKAAYPSSARITYSIPNNRYTSLLNIDFYEYSNRYSNKYNEYD